MKGDAGPLKKYTFLALLSMATVMMAGAGCTNFAAGLVPDETGFDGAVTVISAETRGHFGVITVRVPYLDVRGNPAAGRARLVIHRAQTLRCAPIPAFCHVHYEMGVDGAKHWASEGWAVFTAAYGEDAPLDIAIANGNNLARAILQWARRLPFIDRGRMHLDGGSQGGYMVLAMSADMFPITSATADAPVANWAYNFSYFEACRPMITGYANPADSPLPVVGMVLPLADSAYLHFTRDLSDDTWYRLSPISCTERITSPTLIAFATGDMLVPLEQMSREHIRPCDSSRFPEGYTRDFDTLTLNHDARRTFEECLPEQERFIHVEPLQPGSYEVTLEMRLNPGKRPKTGPERLDRSWSRDHQWSLFYMDEGGPAPYADHTTYAWNTAPDSFVAYYRDAAPDLAFLNGPKLNFLLARWESTLTGLPVFSDGTPVNRRNFNAVERFDVLSGLVAYADFGATFEDRLIALYRESPAKPFGEELDLKRLRELASGSPGGL